MWLLGESGARRPVTVPAGRHARGVMVNMAQSGAPGSGAWLPCLGGMGERHAPKEPLRRLSPGLVPCAFLPRGRRRE